MNRPNDESSATSTTSEAAIIVDDNKPEDIDDDVKKEGSTATSGKAEEPKSYERLERLKREKRLVSPHLH